jgi:HAMP domain-containing protein
VGVSIDHDGAIARRAGIGLAVSLLLVLAAFMGWALWAGGAHARRLATLARVARRVADGDFGARANVGGRDEVARLGADVDRMAERLGALERRAASSWPRSRTTADTAHDHQGLRVHPRAPRHGSADVQRLVAIAARATASPPWSTTC